MVNVSDLLTNARDDSFLARLEPTSGDAQKLRSVRREVRSHLRLAFEQVDPERIGGHKPKPVFYTQGSFAYGTLNRPCYTPPQQMDMDDGCYLPLSFMRQTRPSVAAKAFFDFVDAVLGDLARSKGWRLITDKPTCTRLGVDSATHVDVPLYAITDVEHKKLMRTAVASHEGVFKAFSEARLSPDRWDMLPSDAVLMAHREQDWQISDPRKIHDWFLNALEWHGEELRRVSRYLKAWRDHHHDHIGRISSITLMACAAASFEDRRVRRVMPRREDQMLAVVFEDLAQMITGAVQNPAEETIDEDLTARLDQETRSSVALMAQQAAETMHGLAQRCFDAHRATDTMRNLLGSRVPLRPDLVTGTEPAAVAALVSSTPAVRVAAPEVGRSISA